MVSGLETFKSWFSSYTTRYVVIGGTACNLILNEYGARQRATQDIDMIIVAEAFDEEFYKRFIEFVRTGGYTFKGKANKYALYRFEDPTDETFPLKIELLSKRPDFLKDIDTDLGPIQTIEATNSLSAILLDDEYYHLVPNAIEVVDDIPILGLHYLPLFKIHAWANLTDDKAAGKQVHSDEIKKHANDVLRLCALFEPETRIEVSENISLEVERFVNERPWDDAKLRNLSLSTTSDEMADIIRSSYVVTEAK